MSKGRVLIADDESTFVMATAELLRERGYDVWTAENADDAKTVLALHQPQVLMADIHMAGNDHLQFVGQAAALYPELQIIVATGHPTIETAADAVHLSALAYLVKPFELDELCNHLDHGIAQAKLLEVIQRARQRLFEWTGTLEATSQAVRESATKAETAEDAFLILSMGNIIAVLNDMRQVVEAHQAGDAETVARQKLGCPTPVAATDALRDTITTLVRTKDAFKSRELGALRKRLEAVLGGKGNGSPPDTASGDVL